MVALAGSCPGPECSGAGDPGCAMLAALRRPTIRLCKCTGCCRRSGRCTGCWPRTKRSRSAVPNAVIRTSGGPGTQRDGVVEHHPVARAGEVGLLLPVREAGLLQSLRPLPAPARPPQAGWMKSSMSGVDGSRSPWVVPVHSRHGGPFSRCSRTMDSDVIDWQGRQIVQSHLDLNDLLPLFASPEPRLFGLQGISRIDP